MKLNMNPGTYFIGFAPRSGAIFFFCRGGEVFAALFRYFCKCCQAFAKLPFSLFLESSENLSKFFKVLSS